MSFSGSFKPAINRLVDKAPKAYIHAYLDKLLQGGIQVSNFKGDFPLNISERGGLSSEEGAFDTSIQMLYNIWGDLPPCTLSIFFFFFGGGGGGKLLIWDWGEIPPSLTTLLLISTTIVVLE